MNGIALPIIRVDGHDYDLSAMDRPDLIDLSALLKADMDNIQYQLDSGHTGSWAKPGWESSAIFARSMKSVQIQVIHAELSRRKESAVTLADMFQEDAFAILSESLFNAIFRISKARYAKLMSTE